MTATNKTYEVNANGGRSYVSDDAGKVADVAATWADQGHEPNAYAKIEGETIRIVRVPVTGKRATKAALIAVR